MEFKDILLTLTSYPDPTPASVAQDAVAIAATFGAHLAAVACERGHATPQPRPPGNIKHKAGCFETAVSVDEAGGLWHFKM